MREGTEGIPHGHAVGFARDLLRGSILRGDFAPGSVMSQAELGEALKIGRTSLREAIRVVQEEGLLVVQPNRRIQVAAFSPEDLEGIFVLRIVLEAAAVRRTVPLMNPEDLGELRAILAKMDYFAGRHDFDRFGVAHREFHAALIGRMGERAAMLAAQLFDHAERYRRAYRVPGAPWPYEIAQLEHHAMLEAAEALDGARCARLLITQYARSIAQVSGQHYPGYELQQVRFACAFALGTPDDGGADALWNQLMEGEGGEA